ncbi:MAG: carbonic anhydrase [Deltaproteobacteria bacterium RBG_13_60_28]|nr:MAG: carbonic anhydrase [Deltaproteobacteria bacterium RBG_13_60_28]
MKRFNLLLVALAMLLALAAPALAAGAGPGVSPDAALTMLKDGNARYVAGKPQYPHQNKERRVLTATKGQAPFATILSCSDSRAPVELIFDQGLGDLFVVRVAGNVAGVDEIASMEYAGEHLHTPLLVVLGHTKCGAVTAVVENAKLHGSLPSLAAKIKPAVFKTRAAHRDLRGDALIAAAIKANVQQAMADLFAKSRIIKDLVKAGKLQVLGALYDLESGKVEWLGPQPGEKASAAGKAGVK